MRRKTRRTLTGGAVLGLLVAIFIAIIFSAALQGAGIRDAERGREAFEKRCTGCHELDKVKAGPPLRSVYGRGAGKDPRFAYSDAMKNSAVVWDETTLDRWLMDTESVIPDNDMAFRMNDAADRANIVAYLRKVAGK